jgi:hypothetical protein
METEEELPVHATNPYLPQPQTGHSEFLPSCHLRYGGKEKAICMKVLDDTYLCANHSGTSHLISCLV